MLQITADVPVSDINIGLTLITITGNAVSSHASLVVCYKL